MAKTSTPALIEGTEAADRFATYARLGWSDEKLGTEFGFTWNTARKYRKLLAPETFKKSRQPAAEENAA